MNTPFYVREIPSTLDGLPAIITSALDALTKRGWIEAGNHFCAHLCLEEALVNAIRHGNKCDTCRNVRLEIHEDDDRCRILVYDEGEGFCPDDVPLPSVSQAGGRGLCLIKHFMDHVEFHDRERCLEMAFQRKSASKGGPTPQ